jgi:hypothetical protein
MDNRIAERYVAAKAGSPEFDTGTSRAIATNRELSDYAPAAWFRMVRDCQNGDFAPDFAQALHEMVKLK